MCNFILLSCDSAIDLKDLETEWIAFKSLKAEDLKYNPELKYLNYKFLWLITSETSPGCACGFRQEGYMNFDMGFTVPEDWLPEDEDDIKATQSFYRVVKKLLELGIQVDSFDLFDNNQGITPIENRIEVNLNKIPVQAFRFYEQVVYEYIL